MVFALPGVQIMDAFDALHDEPGIRLVTVRHEQSTTFMADGYARTTGKVGVGLVVPGPGALNATAGLGTAYATSSPVLLICGQIESYNLGKERGALHEVEDLQDVFRPITKWCSRMMSVEAIPEGVHEAMRQLGTGRPVPWSWRCPGTCSPARVTPSCRRLRCFPGRRRTPRRSRRLRTCWPTPAVPSSGRAGAPYAATPRRGHGACRRPERPRDHHAPGEGGHPGDQPLSWGPSTMDTGPARGPCPSAT